MSKLLQKKVAHLCEHAIERHGFPGLSIAIVKNGETWLVKGFGKKRLGARAIVNGETMFHMASVTKTFTSSAVMKLAVEGSLDLDAPVAWALADFEMSDPRYRTITARHLLSHVSGLPDVTDFGWDRPEFDDEALMRHILGLSDGTLKSAPGRHYSYSDLGYEVLGHLIARASGMPYEEYVRRNLLAPAGMTASSLLLKEVDARRLACPHAQNAAGEIEPSDIFPYNRRHAPSSTLYSSANDMAKWMHVLLSRGLGRKSRILPRSAYSNLWRRTNPTRGQFWLEVGMGFFAGRYGRYRFIGHEGSDTGFRASLAVFPGRDLGIAIMTNFDGDCVKDVMRELFEIFIPGAMANRPLVEA